MLTVEWKDELTTGDAEIDRQHRELITRANAFLIASQTGATVHQLDDMVAFLVAYVHEHFGHEKNAMLEHDYYGLYEHIKEHVRIIDALYRLHVDLNSTEDTKEFTVRMAELIGDWYFRHIMTFDTELAGFLRMVE